jgi:type IV secretory pathway VirB10-like protein
MPGTYTGIGARPLQPPSSVEAANQVLPMHQQYEEPAEQQQGQVEIPQALQAVQAIQTEQTRQAELSHQRTVIIMRPSTNPAADWGGTQTQETQKRETQTLETQKRETQTLETQAQLPPR